VIRIPCSNWYREGARWIRQPSDWLDASQLATSADPDEELTREMVGREFDGEPIYRTFVKPTAIVDHKCLGQASRAYLIRRCDALNDENVRQRDLQRRANRFS
jgi:hypothetical protein